MLIALGTTIDKVIMHDEFEIGHSTTVGAVLVERGVNVGH